MNYEYRIERYVNPPTAHEIERFAHQGWRLVSVTVDVAHSKDHARYVAYLERSAASSTPDRTPIPIEGFSAASRRRIATVA